MTAKTNALLRACLLCVLITGICSCEVTHVYQAGGKNGVEQGNQPCTPWQSKPANTFFWGTVIRQDVKITNCWTLDTLKRLNIEEIKVEKNALQILATVLTLGIWEPAKISWRCACPVPCPRNQGL